MINLLRHNQKGNAFLSVLLLLSLSYALFFRLSGEGWGYIGHEKIEEGASSFYLGGADINLKQKE